MTFFGNKHTNFYILFSILILFLFSRYAFQFDVPRFALSTILIVAAMLGDQDEILAVLMCCIPLHNAVNFSVTLIVCSIIYVLKNIENVRFRVSSILILLMVIYELLHAFTVVFQPVLFFADFAPLFVLLAIMSIDFKKIDYAFIVRTIAIILSCLCLSLLVNFIISSSGDYSLAVSNLKRIGIVSVDETLYGTGVHPNILGVLNIIAVTGLWQLKCIGKNIDCDNLLVVFLTTFGMLTSSRTFLVCFLFMFILFLLGEAGGFKRKIIVLTKMILVIAFALLAMFIMFPKTLEYYVMRFSYTDITNLTTGRDILFSDYYNYIFDNVDVFFYGVGLNNFIEKVMFTYNMSTHTPHNSIQEIIVAWGIPGFVMMCTLFVIMIVESKRYGSSKTAINYIPLFIILLKSMAGQLLTVGYTMLALSFSYLSLCQDFSKRSEKS